MPQSIQIIQLKPKKEKLIRLRHPWIYSGALRHPPQGSGPALLTDPGGKMVAAGFAEKQGAIAFRAVTWSDVPQDLQARNFWQPRFERALHLRISHLDKARTDCYRLVHGEADGVPGLVVDIYGDYAVMQNGWKGAETCVPVWRDILGRLGFKNILRRRTGATKPGQWIEPEGVLSGHIPDRVPIRENNIRYMVDLVHGQKTGFFLDQRDNRQLLRTLAAEKRVLNAFCYTGGFSLAAAVGNAKEVVSVDLSQTVLDQMVCNWKINDLHTAHQIICADVFAWLRTLPRHQFDLIVLDPPAFATSKAAIPRASRGYKDILLQSFKALRSGGLVMIFSCSQHMSSDLLQKIAFGAALDAQREVLVLKRLSAGWDHPFSLYHPEGEYLKGLLLTAW